MVGRALLFLFTYFRLVLYFYPLKSGSTSPKVIPRGTRTPVTCSINNCQHHIYQYIHFSLNTNYLTIYIYQHTASHIKHHDIILEIKIRQHNGYTRAVPKIHTITIYILIHDESQQNLLIHLRVHPCINIPTTTSIHNPFSFHPSSPQKQPVHS